MDFDHLSADLYCWTVSLGHVLCSGCGCDPGASLAHDVASQAQRSARPRQTDSYLGHVVGILQLFAIFDYLGGKPARRNQLVHAASVQRVGMDPALASLVSLRGAVCAAAVAHIQTPDRNPDVACRLAHGDALPRPVLVHRAELSRKSVRQLAVHRDAICDWRILVVAVFPKPGFTPAAAPLRPEFPKRSGTRT